MKFGKILRIGGSLAGAYLGVPVPSILNQRTKKSIARDRDDPEKGLEAAAHGLRGIVQACFPEQVLLQFDRMAVVWAMSAAEERQALEEPEEKPKRKRRKRASSKRKAKRSKRAPKRKAKKR